MVNIFRNVEVGDLREFHGYKDSHSFLYDTCLPLTIEDLESIPGRTEVGLAKIVKTEGTKVFADIVFYVELVQGLSFRWPEMRGMMRSDKQSCQMRIDEIRLSMDRGFSNTSQLGDLSFEKAENPE